MNKEIQKDVIGNYTRVESQEGNPSLFAKKKIEYMISSFQDSISENLEVAVAAVNLPNGDVLHIRNVDYLDPDMIIYKGLDSKGQTALLMQHFSQTNFMLIGVKPIEDKPFRIGFTN